MVTMETLSLLDKLVPESPKVQVPESGINKNYSKIEMSRKQRVKWYVCAVCSAKFTQQDLFHAHVNELHPDEFPFPCPQCPKRFAEAIHLKTHETIHDPNRFQGEPQHICEFCGKKYHLKVSLATHRSLKHLGYKPPKRTNPVTREQVILPRNKGAVKPRLDSGRGGKRKGHRNMGSSAHRASSPTEQEPITSSFQPPKKLEFCFCTICKISLRNQVEFQNHLNTVHGDIRRHPCRHCGKRFASYQQRRAHETIHNPHRFHGEPTFSCEFCDKKYHVRGSLDSHRKYAHLGRQRPKYFKKDRLLIHHHAVGVKRPPPEVKPEKVLHPCPKCDLKFEYRFQMRKHMRCHSDARPFKCDTCQQTFVSRNCLVNHQRRIHFEPTSGPRHLAPTFMYKMKKSWKCDQCDRQYRLPSQLRVHQRMHTGERPIHCPSCPLTFRTVGGLRCHEKCHVTSPSPLKVFKCLVCGKEGFKRFNEFNNHRKYGHPDFPYQNEREKGFGCGICGKPYFKREEAIICAILKHDSTRLYNQMFRIKCSECPPEVLGHRSLLVLRKHWEVEHGDKPIPAKYRAGMYNEGVKDILPTVQLDKVKAAEIREKGIPPANENSEFPLFVELDLLERPEMVEGKYKGFQCSICEKYLKSAKILRIHTLNVHGDDRKKQVRKGASKECHLCKRTFYSAYNKRKHMERLHKNCRVDGDIKVKQEDHQVTRTPVKIKRESSISNNASVETSYLLCSVIAVKTEAGESETLRQDVDVKPHGLYYERLMNEKENELGASKQCSKFLEPKIVSVSSLNDANANELVHQDASAQICDKQQNIHVKQEPQEEMVPGDEEFDDICSDGFFQAGDVHVKKEILETNEMGSMDVCGMGITMDGEYKLSETKLVSGFIGKRGRGRPRKHPVLPPEKVNLSMETIPAKRGPGRPSNQHQLHRNGHQVNCPGNSSNSTTMEGENEKCFACDFKAKTASILRRHVMAVHIDCIRNDYGDGLLNKSKHQMAHSVQSPINIATSKCSTTVNVKDTASVQTVLGNRQVLLVLTRVDDDDFDFGDLLFLGGIC